MKGICFKEPLFIATIKGIKTQTRRLIKSRTGFFCVCSADNGSVNVWQTDANGWLGDNLIPVKPRYNVGEVLYLKEPYYDWDEWCPEDGEISYKFDNPNKCVPFWNNKLFMPKRYARYFIKITAVRAERLQDISDEDCIREGIVATESIAEDVFDQVYENGLNMTDKTNGVLNIQYETPREAYKELINSIHGKGAWEDNPFVWVYDYELYKENININSAVK